MISLSTERLLELRNDCNKGAGYKISIRNHSHLHTLAIMQPEKEMKKILSIRGSKRIKCLGINLVKKIKNLYSENYKMLLKEMKTTQITGKIPMFMDWKIQYVMPILPKVTDLRQFLQSPISIFFSEISIQVLEENIKEKLHDIEFGDDFLTMTPKA